MDMPRHRHTGIGISALLLCLLLVSPSVHATEWHLSFQDATAQAVREGKPILIQFTGSDWCRWCHVLEQEVFDTPRFKTWAKNRVVLLVLDFPRRKKLPPELRKQNQALAQHYGVQGYPTVLFLTPDGTEIGQTGYRRGGPDTWIAEVESILKTAPAIHPQPPTPVASTLPNANARGWQTHAPAATTAAATTLAQRTARAHATTAATQTRPAPSPTGTERPHQATPTPRTRIQESYIRAEAISFRHRIPLLVALHPQGQGAAVAEQTLREMNSILTHPAVARASQSHLAVVHLTLPLQGTDRVIWSSVARQYGIQTTAVALLDPDGKLLHLENGDRLRAETFLRGIQPYMPTAALQPEAGMRPEPAPRTPTRPAATQAFTRTITQTTARPVYRGEWLADFTQAQEIAHALKRPMLVDFTGSDWCGWCVRLKEEIFTTPTFMAYARKHFVLVQLDYPRFKEQSPTIRSQNAALAKQYDIQSFPTILLMHADGTPQQRLGYVAGGPDAFIQRLESVSAMR